MVAKDKVKLAVGTALCVLLGVFLGVVYHYAHPTEVRSHSALTELRKRARSELKAVPPAGVNPDGLVAAKTQPPPVRREVDRWHDVRVLLAGKNIRLSDSEIALLQSRYADLVSDRETIELGIANRQKIDETKTLITIPAYPGVGTDLYVNFVRDLTADFGVTRSDQILDAIEQTILASNFNLGLQTQSILVEEQQGLLKISRGRSPVTIMDGSKKTVLLEVNATGFYDKTQLNAFAYLKPLLVSHN